MRYTVIRYTLYVPRAEPLRTTYIKRVLGEIHGLANPEEILEEPIKSEQSHVGRNIEADGIQVKIQDEHYVVTFRQTLRTTFHNIIPVPSIDTNIVYFSDAGIVEQIKSMTCRSLEINLDCGSINDLILELVKIGIVEKFVEIDMNQFYCVMRECPCGSPHVFTFDPIHKVLKITDGVRIYFDIDEGFKKYYLGGSSVSVNLKNLQDLFNNWKMQCNLNLPIIPNPMIVSGKVNK